MSYRDADEVEDAILISQAIRDVSRALKLLGNADAATPMGAVEAHGQYVGDAIREGLFAIAEAIHEK